jgi:hypothetical protein
VEHDDLPEDLEQDLLPPYDELQRWYSGFVHLRHAHGYTKNGSFRYSKADLAYGRADRWGLPAGAHARMK